MKYTELTLKGEVYKFITNLQAHYLKSETTNLSAQVQGKKKEPSFKEKFQSVDILNSFFLNIGTPSTRIIRKS